MPTTVKDDNFLNFITSQEKYIDKIYKKLVDSNCMFKETQKHLKPVGTSGKLFQKKCLPFRLILSVLQKPACRLANILVPILEPLTTNKYTVKDMLKFPVKLLSKIPVTSSVA